MAARDLIYEFGHRQCHERLILMSITVMERLELLRTERPSAPDASGILSMDTQAPIAEWGNTEANLG